MKRVPIPPGNKKFKYKEQLYALFYELTSEVKGKDIELEEEEYINNIQTIKFSKLISYVREMIHILINKQNSNNTNALSTNYKLNDKLSFGKDLQSYERIIQQYEAKERLLLRKLYELITIKEINELSLNNYHQMEIEFVRMKDQVKYEEGRFLNNERKDNEVIIIRQENAILKKTIADLEEKSQSSSIHLSNRNKEIKKLKESIKQYKAELYKSKMELIKNSNGINCTNNIIKCLYSTHNKSIDKSPSEVTRLKMSNMAHFQSKTMAKSIIQYSQSQLNKSMGLNGNTNIMDIFSNKTLSTHKSPNIQNNNSMNSVLLSMTQRESSIGHNLTVQHQLKNQQQNIIKPYCIKLSMPPHNQSRSPMPNSYSLSSKRNQSSSRISLTKKPSNPFIKKYNYKMSLNSTKG